jgi:hypothetical protein
VADFCEHGIVSSGSIEGKESLDKLSDYQFLKSGLCSMRIVSGSKITVFVACSRNVQGISRGVIITADSFHANWQIHKINRLYGRRWSMCFQILV